MAFGNGNLFNRPPAPPSVAGKEESDEQKKQRLLEEELKKAREALKKEGRDIFERSAPL